MEQSETGKDRSALDTINNLRAENEKLVSLLNDYDESFQNFIDGLIGCLVVSKQINDTQNIKTK